MTPSAQTEISVTDEQGIRDTIDHYVEGLRTGDVETLKLGFHEQAVMSGYMGESVMVTPIQGLYDFVADTAPPVESGDSYRCEIQGISVTGNIATVEIREQKYLGYDFIDFFHLLKIDGRWWITSKLFQAV